MKLSKPAFDAALECARIFLRCSIDREEDRRAYRLALIRLVEVLPPDADAKKIVLQVAKWEMANSIAAVIEIIPEELLI